MPVFWNRRDGAFRSSFEIMRCLRRSLFYRPSSSSASKSSLLESYALELLADAQDYAIHANRTTLPALLPADLLLAAELRGDVHGVPSSLPTYEDMIDFASEVNRAPLPPIPTKCYNGVALPPVEQQLTARTFDVVNGARVVQRMMRGGEVPLTPVELGLLKRSNKAGEEFAKGPSRYPRPGIAGSVPKGQGSTSKDDGVVDSGGGSVPQKAKRSSSQGSYGAGRGRQIAVNIKSKKAPTDGGITMGTAPDAEGTAASSSAVTSGGKSTAFSNTGHKAQKRKLTEL